MLLASLAFAFLTAPQTPPAENDGPVKTWENLDVLRRMLVRQIGAKHDAISAAPRHRDDGDGDGDLDVFSTRDGKVTSAAHVTDSGGETTDKPSDQPRSDSLANTFTRVRYQNWYEATLGSDAEYAPGLGAIIGVTVPVKVRLVTAEPKTADAKKPAETKNADDEAWERLARGDDSLDRRVKQLIGADGKLKDEPRREFRYEDAAVKALKETVVDTISRFGSRLGLAHGERLAVVVTLSAGSVVREGDGGNEKKNEPVVSDDGPTTIYFDGRGDNRLLYEGRIALAGRRFVLQVSGDDLRAHRGGDLDRDELLRKMRIEEFTLPASSTAGSSNYSWSYRPAR